MNRWTGMGRLGKDPEMRSTQNGQAICNMRVACESGFWDKRANEWKSVTEWVNVVVFGRTAAQCGDHLRKGSKVLVEGKMQTREWSDREGNKRWTTEIKADMVEFFDPPPERGAGDQADAYSEAGGTYGEGAQGSFGDSDGDDDIPF